MTYLYSSQARSCVGLIILCMTYFALCDAVDEIDRRHIASLFNEILENCKVSFFKITFGGPGRNMQPVSSGFI